MIKRELINDFLDQKKLAVLGASRTGKKFGNTAYRELRGKGYELYPVHPTADLIEGDKSYRSLKDLPEKVGALFVSLPSEQTEKIVREAADEGIKRVWIQQGAESKVAVDFCKEQGIGVVHGECILMFAQPVGSIHRLHRWIWKVLGKLP